MKNLKEFIKNFYQSKFNIVLTVLVALFLIALLMSRFVSIFSFIAVGLFAIDCFLIGIKVCVWSKKTVQAVGRYSVFFDEEDSEVIEKPKKNNKFFILGVFLIIVSLFMVYSFITMVV